MKRILIFFALFLGVELGTSLWIWQGQPSHGLVDMYHFSFFNYAFERLVPWAILACILLGLFWLASNVFFRSR